MIRIKGFARKTRRSTKGGSLPDQMHSAVRTDSDPATPALDANRNGNGTHSTNGNGAESNGQYAGSNGVTTHGQGRNGDSRLHSNFSTNGANGSNGTNGSNGSNGQGLLDREPILRTVFARAEASANGRATLAIPAWKRILDLTCILLTLPVWLPLLLVTMVWIRAVSPGPIFYRQERVGYRRSRFMIFKFRTMHVNAETKSHEEYFAHLMRVDCPMTKLDAVDDSRLIRCGLFLRASGLDELPQIFNVLRGDMSLVGPRPCLPNEFERYSAWHQERVNAPPGLTGFWQVNGKNKTTFSEMITMDIHYGNKMSIWLDLWIMLRTIPALIAQTRESRRIARSEASNPSEMVPSDLHGSVKKI